jgi:hypothetical protein
MKKPAWLGDEVTTDHRYYNAYLSSNPLYLVNLFCAKLNSNGHYTDALFTISMKALSKIISLDFTNGPLSVTSTITDSLTSLVTLILCKEISCVPQYTYSYQKHH